MKVKINHQIETEVEIEIPSYYQKSCHYYKVVSETNVLSLCDLSGHESINHSQIGILFACGEPNKITPEHFNEALITVSNKLLSL